MTIRPALLALALAAPALADPVAVPSASPEGRAFAHVALPDADYADVTLFWPGPTSLAAAGREGLYHLAPQLLFEEAGGRRLDEINEALNDAGVGVGVINSFIGTALFVQAVDAEAMAAGAAVARDLLHDPALRADDLDWLKGTFADGLAETERDPATMLQRAMGALLAPDDRRLAALTNRPFETVERVTVADVAAWREATFHAEPTIVAAGPLDPAAIGAAIDAILAGLPAPAAAPRPPEPFALEGAGRTIAVRAPEAETALVSVAFPAPLGDAALDAALQALAGGDGSRLFARLRESEGASYGFGATSIPLLADLQVVSIEGAVPPARAAEAVAAIREELARLRADGLTQPELDAAREVLRGAEDAHLADPGTITSLLIDAGLRGEPSEPAALRRADALTLAEVSAALGALIPEAVAALVVTPEPDAAGADCVVDVPEDVADACGG